jgi:transposase
VLDAIRVPRVGRGRPRKRPERLLADRGYAKGIYRRMLRARAIPHTIPERSDHRERRAKRVGRPPSFDADLYVKRHVVERCVNRLKQWRAARYALRQTSAQLQGYGVDRLADDLARIMRAVRQTLGSSPTFPLCSSGSNSRIASTSAASGMVGWQTQWMRRCASSWETLLSRIMWARSRESVSARRARQVDSLSGSKGSLGSPLGVSNPPSWPELHPS